MLKKIWAGSSGARNAVAGTLAAGILFSATNAQAVVMTQDIVASADGFVQSSGVLGLSTGDMETTIRTSRSGNSNIRHGIFEFDLSSIPDTATLLSATLQLTTFGLLSNVGSAPGTITFGTYSGDGAVSTTDFNSGTTTAATEVYATGGAGVPANSLLSISLVDLTDVLGAIAGTSSDFVGIETSTHNFVTFRVHSTESGAAVVVPTLSIEYDTIAAQVPEPVPLALLAAGLAFFARSGRRERA